MATEEPRWLLLVHQLPPKPAYLRVKVGRRLQALGAVALKNSVYALPRGDPAQEDLTWVLREIAESGGEAFLVAARFLDGLGDAQVQARFDAIRSEDYQRIQERARRLAAALEEAGEIPPAASRAVAELRRIEAQLSATRQIDFFEAPGRDVAEGIVEALGGRLRAVAGEPGEGPAGAPPVDPRRVCGGTWVTRRGIHVDRIACAWLIRRFLDPDARFKFVAARGYRPLPGEIRFDMFDAEFTHDGDRCSFEVLLDAATLKDPALRAIGEVVHDIDLKDGKFGRPEAPGLARLLEGLAATHRDDARRLERGAALFEDLHAAFRRRPR